MNTVLSEEQLKRVFEVYGGATVLYKGERLRNEGSYYHFIRTTDIDHKDEEHFIKECTLVLKSLTELTNEECIELAKLSGNVVYPTAVQYEVYTNHFGKKVVSWGDSNSHKYVIETLFPDQYYNIRQGDQLRQWGYMVPFEGIDLFEAGIAINAKSI
jgi:hypothetical protein